MALITINTWLDSGAIHSSYKTSFEIESDEWDAMSDDEKDECAKEYICDRMKWGWKVGETQAIMLRAAQQKEQK